MNAGQILPGTGGMGQVLPGRGDAYRRIAVGSCYVPIRTPTRRLAAPFHAAGTASYCDAWPARIGL